MYQIHLSLIYVCDASEVDAIIIQLSITKASGPNGIPTKILQMISKEN